MSGNVLDAELEARRNNSVLTLKWDKTDLEIKTRSVEWTLQPLINQVFLFCNVVQDICPYYFQSPRVSWVL